MRGIIFCFLFVVAYSANACAGPLDPIAKLTLGAFLDQVEKSADNVVITAANQGNGLVTHAADEANLLAGNVRLEYSDSLDKTIGDLDQEQQTVIAKLFQLDGQINGLLGKAYDFKDTTLLDVANLEAGLPFTHVAEFYVQRVDDVSFLDHGGDYAVILYAHGVGLSSDGTTDISASLDGKPMQLSASPDQTTLGKAIISLPGSSIQPLFDEKKLVTPKLTLHVTIYKSGWFGTPIFSTTHGYDVPIYLNLYPAFAASLTVHARAPQYGWVSGPVAYGDQITVPDKDGCKGGACEAHNTVDVRVPGPPAGPPTVDSEQISQLDLDCPSASDVCRFQDNVKPVITDNGKHGIITFNTNSHSVNYRAIAHTQQWQQTGVAATDTSVNLYFSTQANIAVPTDATLITVDVKTFTGTSYTIPIMGPDPNSLVNYISRTKDVAAVNQDLILLSANPPS